MFMYRAFLRRKYYDSLANSQRKAPWQMIIEATFIFLQKPV
jgi:hypothetical protein